MASSNSPCAACKFLRRKCTQGCVFAPYFPPDQPTKFANVHRVFGASNVAKLLNDLTPAHREDAVNSLAYEAEARIRDPIYGCVGYISVLQHRVKQMMLELNTAKKELSAFIGPAALGPFLPTHPSPYGAVPFHQQQQHHSIHAASSSMQPFGVQGMGMGLGLSAATPEMLFREHAQQMAEAQQLAAAVREQELLRTYEQQQQQQQEIVRYNNAFDGRGYNQMGVGSSSGGGGVVMQAVKPEDSQPSILQLVSPQNFDNQFHLQQQQQQQQLQLQFFDSQPQHQRAGSDEGRSGIGPSS